MMDPDAAPVLDLIEAFRRSKTMFAAVELGIFDRVAERPATLGTLARDTGTEPHALERLLDACVGLGFLHRRGALYANTPIADEYLRRASPRSMTGYILYSNRALFPIWSHLEDALREGTHRWTQTFGLEGPLFSHFFRTDESMREFIAGMHGFGLLTSPAVVSAFDLGRFGSLADLGGATGHLAMAACAQYPAMRAVVFDLPRVAAIACEYTGRSEVAARVAVEAGDFFADPLPRAELYAVGRILHDWSEPKIRALLARIHDALPAEGGLLVAEKLLDPDKSGPVAAQMQSLNMLLVTEGRERTLGEYTALLREAGFRQVDGRRTGTPLDAVLAIK